MTDQGPPTTWEDTDGWGDTDGSPDVNGWEDGWELGEREANVIEQEGEQDAAQAVPQDAVPQDVTTPATELEDHGLLVLLMLHSVAMARGGRNREHPRYANREYFYAFCSCK